MYNKRSEFLAELMGSMFIALFGCGVVASVNIGNNGAPINIHIAWGLLLLSVYMLQVKSAVPI